MVLNTMNVIKVIYFVVVLCLSSMGLANYQAAQAARKNNNYIKAAAYFFQAYSYPKDAGEKFKAEFGLADSLQKSGVLYSASKYYSIIARRGPINNPFFRQALNELGNINGTIPLGQTHVIQLFKVKVSPSSVPLNARGFYFYYLGIAAFYDKSYEVAVKYFKKVPSSSLYYYPSIFYLGVISNLRGKYSQAIAYFESIIRNKYKVSTYMYHASLLNIARVYYETRQYINALSYYQQIPRDSYDMWLDAIWEGAWAFFLIQKYNNALGNLHTIQSPFFINRFYPESYILQAITFLKLCRYDEVKRSLVNFRIRYKPVFDTLKAAIDKYNDPKQFFKIIYNYYHGNINQYKAAWPIFDKLSRTDIFKEAYSIGRFVDKEIMRINSLGNVWKQVGLADELIRFLNVKKEAAYVEAGILMHRQAKFYFTYLHDLSDQTSLIQAEMMEGKLNILRKKINVSAAEDKAVFIGGMQKLKIGQDIEYWPFEGEYWEDELGHYVYNLDSKCKGK